MLGWDHRTFLDLSAFSDTCPGIEQLWADKSGQCFLEKTKKHAEWMTI